MVEYPILNYTILYSNLNTELSIKNSIVFMDNENISIDPINLLFKIAINYYGISI